MYRVLRKGPGLISRVDRYLVRGVSSFPGGNHDTFFRRLSASATHGKLWVAAAAVMAAFPGKPRRAAMHGLIAQAVASAVTNVVFKTLLPRARPLPEHLPVFRFVQPQPTSSSMPSGHSASAIAFALGAGMIKPVVGAALAPVALGVAYSRVHTGAHWPSDVVFGSAIGAGAALVTRKWWPVRPPFPGVSRTVTEAPSLPGGEGLSIVVNTLGGSFTEQTADALQEIFPNAYIKTIERGKSLDEAIQATASHPDTQALGVWGGDGTVGTAAAAAVEHSLPLLVLPGGTLNHFARDTGTANLKDAVAAAAAGDAARADVGIVTVERGLAGNPETADLVMLNTASVGLYPNLVRRREQLQPALGKPLAGVVAMFRTFAVGTPTTLIVDGVRHKLWIAYIGRGRYYPRDHAPLSRPVLDDGVLDVRMITADESFARLRLLWSVLTGTVATSRITHLREASAVRIESEGSPMALAVDGEALAGVRSVRIRVEPRALTYYSPRT
ncbi:phosphatase PAP2 family protein [Pseudarthrobacter sp. AL07]|uniref:bifunctional phosphatase PAP2/diacylglycerol kinase family protein n=1 Tax=unclassified Pseudarthrobacter TaxID=2647000 RepID=UPI00249B1E2A|nr:MULTISPECIES: bifunctional phosphatase PAP2/diacylglycerol kinase family protein [unclassified Pseudarthrobacter]MDI3194490.1 phosphatase PAP2 family protein [Pseudarthrobacter sp. AL20]MDI3208642.1 phosphatase PAP2 family protein [Pseudarthrobacter sp. AL07]